MYWVSGIGAVPVSFVFCKTRRRLRRRLGVDEGVEYVELALGVPNVAERVEEDGCDLSLKQPLSR
jgi:hypothetical protein